MRAQYLPVRRPVASTLVPVTDEIDGASVSVTFHFPGEPVAVPGFLVGHRSKSLTTASYGFTQHIREPDWSLRSTALNEFLTSRLDLALSNGVSPAWLIEHYCTLRVYVSLHPDHGWADVMIRPSVIALMAELGAELQLDSI